MIIKKRPAIFYNECAPVSFIRRQFIILGKDAEYEDCNGR